MRLGTEAIWEWVASVYLRGGCANAIEAAAANQGSDQILPTTRSASASRSSLKLGRIHADHARSHPRDASTHR